MRRVAYDKLDAAEIEALLARRTSAVMAFVDARGYPRMVPCWFLWHDGAFHTTSIADKFHVRCIRDNPRGSFCIEIEDVSETMRSNRQVKGVGEFEIQHHDVHDVGRRIRQKYLGAGASVTLPQMSERVIVRLEPTKLTAHGGDLILAQRGQR